MIPIPELIPFRTEPLYIVDLRLLPTEFNYFGIQFFFSRWPTRAGVVKALEDRIEEVMQWQAIPRQFHLDALAIFLRAVQKATNEQFECNQKHIAECYRDQSYGFYVNNEGEKFDPLVSIRFSLEKVWA